MTVAPAAKAEVAEAYRPTLEGIPGLDAEPAWRKVQRAAALARFTSRGFPTVRDEAWRHTSVASIARTAFRRPEGTAEETEELASPPRPRLHGPTAVFVNGNFSPALSSVGNAGGGVEVLSLRQVLRREPKRIESYLEANAAPGSAFADLNAALQEDGAVVFLAPSAIVAEPIHLVFLSTNAAGGPFASHPRSLVVAGAGSEGRIVETYSGPAGTVYLTNAVTEVLVGEGASVDHYRLQQEGEDAFHVGRLAVRLERNGRFSDHTVALGGAIARQDIDVLFAGEGGDCSLDGLFFADGSRHTDVHTLVDHAVPRCTSRQLYKGILNGRGRGVFHGLVLVRAGAQKTNAAQTNRNLLLSRQALVHTTPQLEILADDVACKHGSTTGQLDPAAVFYLRSRGIGEAEAQRLLTRAFASELLDRFRIEPLRAAVERYIETRLSGDGSTAVEAA